ncbi:MAG: HDOD domain-containing protein [Oxalobacter sp.]|nr:MAG: HDOD domain-containing protein [Oxalobacter sp.]
MKISVDEVVSNIQCLPSMPAVVMEVLESVDQESVNLNQLTRKILLDQALTAKILRYANSSFYRTQTKVTTIQQAINLIGISGVRNLIMTTMLQFSFPEVQCKGFDFNVFWHHSVAAAVSAKAIARNLQLNQDYAYTAGLLHDIGRLVLVTRFTKQYECALAYKAEHDCYLLEAERAVLETDHPAVGQMLGAHWNFSQGMQNAIARHHEPDIGAGDLVAAVVHVSDAIAHGLDFTHDPNDLVPPVSMTVWNALKLDRETAKRLFREIELRFEAARVGLAA